MYIVQSEEGRRAREVLRLNRNYELMEERVMAAEAKALAAEESLREAASRQVRKAILYRIGKNNLPKFFSIHVCEYRELIIR